MIYALNGGKRMNRKQVPASVPEPMSNFIASLIRRDVLSRPQKDLFDEFVKIRHNSFGRARSGMKAIKGL
jgi:hypothetical protein